MSSSTPSWLLPVSSAADCTRLLQRYGEHAVHYSPAFVVVQDAGIQDAQAEAVKVVFHRVPRDRKDSSGRGLADRLAALVVDGRRVVHVGVDADGVSVVAGQGVALEDLLDEQDDHAEAAAATSGSEDRSWWFEQPKQRAALLSLWEKSDEPCLYVYSRDVLREHIGRLRSNLTAVSTVFYAIKANGHEDVLREVYDAGLGFECVSLAECNFVLRLFPKLERSTRLLFTPNFAPRAEYEAAFELGVIVNVDNLYALREWPEVFAGRSICVRVDPGRGAGHHKHVKTGGAQSKFGVSVPELTSEETRRLVLDNNVKVTALHIHAGSGIADVSNWIKNAELLAGIVADGGKHVDSVRAINLGGGFGVRYRRSDPEPDLAALNVALQAFRAKNPNLDVWVEPGRFVAAQCGVLVGCVTQLKSKVDRHFVGITCGMNSLIRPALYDSYHDIVNLTASPSGEDSKQQGDDATYVADVVGPICETGDVLGHARTMPKSTKEGDVIVIATAGAYGRVMSSAYNMRPAPKEFVV